jgi:hypothetical protein
MCFRDPKTGKQFRSHHTNNSAGGTPKLAITASGGELFGNAITGALVLMDATGNR